MTTSSIYIGEKIKIRPYRDSDVEQLYEAAKESIEHVHPWLPWCHPEYSRKDSQQWIERTQRMWQENREFEFAVLTADEVMFLGGCGLNQIDHPHKVVNLWFWVRGSARGQDVAPTAGLMTARFAFEQLGFARIEIIMSVENRASQRVAEKMGATQEGVLRERMELHGSRHNAYLYSLLAGEIA